MIDSPVIAHVSAQTIASIRFTIPRAEIRQVMGPGIQELMDTLASQGIEPAGPRLSHHLRMHPEVFDFEIGIPIDAPLTPVGRVQVGLLPATQVARTVYHGPYEGLSSAWGEFGAWIAAGGYATGPNLWELYLVGPESSSDPADWRTELNRPIVG